MISLSKRPFLLTSYSPSDNDGNDDDDDGNDDDNDDDCGGYDDEDEDVKVPTLISLSKRPFLLTSYSPSETKRFPLLTD